MQEFRPPTAAKALMMFLAVGCAMPLAGVAAGLVIGSSLVPARTYGLALLMTLPLAVAFGAWINRRQFIRLGNSSALFSFTRFCFPRTIAFAYADVAKVVFVGGMFARDGKPRPLMEFWLKSGARSWVAFPFYTGQQIGELIASLEAHGLTVEDAAAPTPD